MAVAAAENAVTAAAVLSLRWRFLAGMVNLSRARTRGGFFTVSVLHDLRPRSGWVTHHFFNSPPAPLTQTNIDLHQIHIKRTAHITRAADALNDRLNIDAPTQKIIKGVFIKLFILHLH